MSETIISIRHLKKEYPNVTPLKDVSVDIKKGDVISIIGPSGTGKSTFLRCMNLLETPTAGEILIDGCAITDPKSDVPALRRKMGMVFQSFNLFNHLTIIENIMLAPVDLLHLSKNEAYNRGMELLRTVGLADKANNLPEELSGGQKQRAAIARTLAMQPEIVLFDEPTSALDPTMVSEVLSVIRNLAKQGLTMLIVTHEMKFARDVSTRVFYMDEGGIYEDGTSAQIFGNPTREKTRLFVKRLSQFKRIIPQKDADLIQIHAELSEFSKNQFLARKNADALDHIFEELVLETLSKNDSSYPITFTVNYRDEDQTCEVAIEHSDTRFTLESGMDEISRKLLSAVSDDISLSQDGAKQTVRVQLS